MEQIQDTIIHTMNFGCYTSIVNQSGLNDTDNIYEYMAEQKGTLASVYFTALRKRKIFNV